MSDAASPDPRASLPAVDRFMALPAVTVLEADWGRPTVLAEARQLLAETRQGLTSQDRVPDTDSLIRQLASRLSAMPGRGPRPVFNLTGTVIHTNLGRSPLPRSAITAMMAAGGSTDVEFDLASGRRGERDHHVERLLCQLTGAEAATVVNNNAAAVLLTLNTFADGREVPVSRGELVEIGGSFRIPDIMRRAGARLIEVGTTNRTHPQDYAEAIGPDTGMLFKVHPSNYVITGFQRESGIGELAAIARAHGLPLAWDLGSGSLVDTSRFGLAREPMPGDALAAGADLVTFSGDKLLGGPQAGIIVGSQEAVAAIRRNPLKRALRVDKLILAALAAVLRLYGDEDALRREVPVLRLLTRGQADILGLAERVSPQMAACLGPDWRVDVIELASQIGSGALPVANLPSAGLAIAPVPERGRGEALDALHLRLRRLPVPIIGRVQQDRLLLDLRCLEDEAGLLAQLPELAAS